ncbi:MAG TPA: helix-turn-helix domain-containing protein [Thermohalobaculum sp.]|nr:helix-turn-helix domain-containing protein [Thermohalobaculum sp.]
MSISVMTEVGRLRLAARPKLVLLKLADCADDDGGNAYPSVATIAAYAGAGRRSVQRILAAYVLLGVLVIESNEAGGAGRTRRYRIDLKRARSVIPVNARGAEDAPFFDPVARTQDGEKGATTTPFSEAEKGATTDKKGATTDTKGCHPCHPNLPEPSENLAHARAREGGAQEAGSGAPATGTKPTAGTEREPDGSPAPVERAGEPPACRHWNACEARLMAAVGPEFWRTWVLGAIPLDDDGETLTLAVETRVIADVIKERAGEALEAVLGRRLACVRAPTPRLGRAIEARRHVALGGRPPQEAIG